ncbi:MAG: ComF family protein [Gemmatimonadales bacterium]
MKLSSWGTDLVELLLPAGCISCGAWIPRGKAELVCGRCRSRFRAAPWPRCPRCHFPRGAGRPDAPDCLECRPWSPALAAARYAFVLATPVDDLVHALKYEGWPALAGLMGGQLAEIRLPDDDRASVVVPVPTTTNRRRRRGYNQAELLAERFAACTGRSLRNALVRRSEGRSQTSLSPAERRANVRGVFAPNPSVGSLEGARVLLVDDVLTTGSTAAEAATTLAAMGAAHVTLVAFARALP